GRDLRYFCHAPVTGHGYPRQTYCSRLAVAEWVRGETDRHDPTGMSRPSDCARTFDQVLISKSPQAALLRSTVVSVVATSAHDFSRLPSGSSFVLDRAN